MTTPHVALTAAELLGLFGHFLVLSLLAVGGAITTAPDMHRYIVGEHHWITDAQFTTSIAIAQAGTRAIVAALKKEGADVKYTEYKGGGHECASTLKDPKLAECTSTRSMDE